MNSIDYQRRPTRIRSKKTLKSEAQKAVQWLITTLSIMIAVLSVVFLFTTNESSQKGYTLQQQKLKNEQLKDINENLTTQITQATAFSHVETSETLTTMEEIDEKKYVTSEDNEVE